MVMIILGGKSVSSSRELDGLIIVLATTGKGSILVGGMVAWWGGRGLDAIIGGRGVDTTRHL